MQSIFKKLNPNKQTKKCPSGGIFHWRLQIMVLFQLVSCQLAQLSMSIGEWQGPLPEHECWGTEK